jgi:hypothetical protein
MSDQLPIETANATLALLAKKIATLETWQAITSDQPPLHQPVLVWAVGGDLESFCAVALRTGVRDFWFAPKVEPVPFPSFAVRGWRRLPELPGASVDPLPAPTTRPVPSGYLTRQDLRSRGWAQRQILRLKPDGFFKGNCGIYWRERITQLEAEGKHRHEKSSRTE